MLFFSIGFNVFLVLLLLFLFYSYQKLRVDFTAIEYRIGYLLRIERWLGGLSGDDADFARLRSDIMRVENINTILASKLLVAKGKQL